jgi:hypothetical protein
MELLQDIMKSPLTPLYKRGEFLKSGFLPIRLYKSPFEKGGYRGILKGIFPFGSPPKTFSGPSILVGSAYPILGLLSTYLVLDES